MGDENVFVNNGESAVKPIIDVITGVQDFHYTSYYKVDAPNRCGQGDNGSCWFTMLTDPSSNIHQRAHRGIIIRNFHGQLNGEAWPPTGSSVSPFTFNLIKSRQNNAAKDTASIELGLPKTFLEAVTNGKAKFQAGDYLTGDIELFLPPRQTTDYYGNSQRLRSWLTEAGVNSDFKNGWKLTVKETNMGDGIITTVFKGRLERLYHPRIRVDHDDEARFNLKIPIGMPGILPITVAGVKTKPQFPTNPVKIPEEKLWRYLGRQWEEFGVGGDYQLEKDVLDNSYTFVFSLRLEFEPNPVQNCEQFAFGVTAPSDTNTSCD